MNEVNSGYWYHQAFQNCVKDPTSDFLMPIIFAMDKTTISNSAHLNVYAIMFTTTLFKRHIRNQPAAWKPLGYVPMDRNYYSNAQWDNISAEMNSRRLNIFFDTILQS